MTLSRGEAGTQVPVGALVGLLGDWTSGDRPLFVGLADAVAAAVARGDIAPGGRLPAERVLAARLAVSRGTVMAALELLRERGLVVSRQGSGTRVPLNPPRALLPDLDAAGPSARSRRLSGRFFDQNPAVIDLAVSLLPDAEFLQDDLLPATWSVLEASSGGHGYAPQGLAGLRSELCRYYQDRGLRTTIDELTVTAGAQQALDLVSALAVRPGDCVLVENPTYPGALDTFARHGARIESVSFNSHWDRPSALREAILRFAPRLVYLMPAMHNPTGRSLPDGRRREIARLADEHQLYVIEDDSLADVVFSLREQPLVAAYSTQGRVLTVGSLSKSAWGGLRVGWIRASPGIAARIARIKAARDLGSSPLPQLAAQRILQELEVILGQRRRQLAGRCRALQAALTAQLPDWRWNPPEGGLSLWIQLPVDRAEDFTQLALRRGVAVIPGSAHCVDDSAADRIRLCFSSAEPLLHEGVRRLRTAWDELAGQAGGRSTLEESGAAVFPFPLRAVEAG